MRRPQRTSGSRAGAVRAVLIAALGVAAAHWSVPSSAQGGYELRPGPAVVGAQASTAGRYVLVGAVPATGPETTRGGGYAAVGRLLQAIRSRTHAYLPLVLRAVRPSSSTAGR